MSEENTTEMVAAIYADIDQTECLKHEIIRLEQGGRVSIATTINAEGLEALATILRRHGL